MNSSVTQPDTSPVLTLRLLRQLKSSGKRLKVGDSTGIKLSGGELLIRTLALRRFLLREVIGDDERNVGIFLPPTVPAVATNFAVALCDRVAVNLNYTVSSATLKHCCEKADVRHVLTSRKFIEKVGLDVGAPMVFLEDVKEQITLADKLVAVAQAKLRTADGLHRALGLSHQRHEDPFTIIFTSGSTGIPKGVVLTGGNIDHNVKAIDQCIHLNDQDIVLGILPFFHSFGYTVTLWSAMCLPCACVYHYSPLEARPIGKLAEDYGATVLLGTPTFLRTYIRRVEPRQFGKLNVVVVGAEKMPIPLADDFEQKFGIRPVEGYGTTELSPLVSVNIPPTRKSSNGDGLREGSVGRPVPEVEARIVSPESDEVLDIGQSGLLEIRGPNVMQGYLHEPERTAEVMHDDWYRTGDMAFLDEDGYIHITGRLSRFSKIGGEMVPHIQIEETMERILGPTEDGSLRLAVSAVPCEKRGERLVVLYTELPMPVQELIDRLAAAGLPNLYLPSSDSFHKVEQIPVLGSGKLDLQRLREAAEESVGA